MGRPFHNTEPDVGRSTSQIMRMSVVFPAPFAPSSP